MRPGDFVQFFVEREPDHKPISPAGPSSKSYPRVAFGVGDLSMQDEGYTPPGKVDSIRAERELSQVELDHFGAVSAEGLYLKSSGDLQTKLDVPGTTVSLLLGRSKK